MKPLHLVAKDIAVDALQTAHAAGYSVKPEREPFIVSDLSNLCDDIAYWLEKHMQPESAA